MQINVASIAIYAIVATIAKTAILANMVFLVRGDIMSSKSVEVTATDFSNKRGQYLDDARAGTDVIVRRNNRIAAVMISSDRYEKLAALEKLFDEYYMNEQATVAKKKMLSKKEAADLTQKLLDASK